MADRYTKKDAISCAKSLANALGKQFGNCWTKKADKNVAKIGCWNVDYNPIYGGAVISEIVSEGGGIRHPLGSSRLKPYEFCRATNMAIDAIDMAKKKRR